MQVVVWSKLTSSLEIVHVITSTLTSRAVKVARLLTSSSYEYSPIVGGTRFRGTNSSIYYFHRSSILSIICLCLSFSVGQLINSKETSYIKDKSSVCKVIQYFVLVQYSNEKVQIPTINIGIAYCFLLLSKYQDQLMGVQFTLTFIVYVLFWSIDEVIQSMVKH